MTAIQFNPGPMLLSVLLVFVGIPLGLLIIALTAFLKKKKKVALVFLIIAVLYVAGIFIIGTIYEQF